MNIDYSRIQRYVIILNCITSDKVRVSIGKCYSDTNVAKDIK